MPEPTATPLREVLVCLAGSEEHLVGILVLRQGLSFTRLRTFHGPETALLSSPTTLEQLSRVLELPVRLLGPDDSVFLGVQTLLASRRGDGPYSLKG